MKRIKVAFFAEILTEDFDGAVRTMYQLIQRIDTARYQYLFIYGDGPDKLMHFDSLKIASVTLPVNTSYSVALPMFSQSRLKDKLDDFSVDVVHVATPSWLGSYALNYANDNHVPVITIYHTHFISYIDYYFKHAPFLIKGLKQILAKKHKAFYNRCNVIYVPSDSMRAELCEIGVESTRMKIWKRGINTSLFTPLKKDRALMHRITGNTNPTVIFASRLVWEKNLETLFDIYDELQKRETPVNFLIAGDGIAREACEARMKSAVFTGKVNHEYLSVLYASANVFLFPSVSETYGNVVLEAMASGLPCVIADGGGSKDFIEHGVNGFKCDPYRAADYADKIEMIINSSMLGEQFADEGLQYSRHLSWEQLSGIYFADINRLATIQTQSKPVLA